MKCFCVSVRTVKYFKVLCILLFLVDNVVTQFSANQGVGLPLPIFREGQSQGQSAVRSNSDVNINSPFTIKFDDEETIASPKPTLHIGFDSGVVTSHINKNTASRGPGSLQHIPDPDQDPSIRSLLTHPAVLKKIQRETSSDSAVRVDSVITAHKQIVSGQITYLDLKVVETVCAIGTLDVEACEIDVTEDPYICEVAVWRRAWLNSTKVVDEKTRCAEVESKTSFKNWNKGHDVMRDMNHDIVLRTLPVYLDESQVALEAFDYINRGSESKFKGQMVHYHIGTVKHDPTANMTKVDVKVEYGFTLCLKFPNRKVDDRVCPVDTQRENYICEVTVVSDPNLTTNLKVIPGDDDDIECEKKQSVEEELVVPVKAVCLGCPQPVSLNDPSVLRIAEFAVIEYDRTSDELELHTILRLHKAQTQVVNGIKYYLTLELAETDCRKPLSAVNMNRTLCNQDLIDEAEICEIVVLEQPWQKSTELISARCYDKTDYPNIHRDEFIVPVIGGTLNYPGSGFVATSSVGSPDFATHPSPDTEPWKQSIDFILREFNKREVDDDDDGVYKVISIIEATTTDEDVGQVDHIALELGETICTRRRMSSNCPLKHDEDIEVCAASVLKGNPNSLLSLNCDERDDHHLTNNPVVTPYLPMHQPFFVVSEQTLGAPGGPIEQPTNSSTILNIARFVVDQYNLQSDEDELFTLSRVIKSYSQLAGNVIYTLELELRETECKKYQPVDDVSKCPLELKEDAEICQAEVSVSSSGDAKETKSLTRIFCDDRRDYYVKLMRQANEVNVGSNSSWSSEEASSDKMKEFGNLIADEFDFRSDEENIFVLVRVLEAKTEETGLTHRMKIELAETVCPKYKQKIDKTRCAIDIGEEHKICDAVVTEKPWKSHHEVSKLSCFERDDSREDDESAEVLYPRVHPSAHARPKFLQSTFRLRQFSKESEESNEKYYSPRGSEYQGGRFDSDEDRDDDDDHHMVHKLLHKVKRFNADDDDNERELDDDRDKEEDDDDDRYSDDRDNDDDRYSDDRDDDDDDDKDSDVRQDNDSRSYEQRSHFRSRRAVKDSPNQSPSLMLGAFTSINANDPKVQELSSFALSHLDQLSNDPRRRRVVEVQEANRKIVAGLQWSIKAKVLYTKCMKDSVNTSDLAACEPDTSEPVYVCNLTVWEKPWENYKTVKESQCSPEVTNSS